MVFPEIPNSTEPCLTTRLPWLFEFKRADKRVSPVSNFKCPVFVDKSVATSNLVLPYSSKKEPPILY